MSQLISVRLAPNGRMVLPKPIDIKTLAERVKQELQKAA